MYLIKAYYLFVSFILSVSVTISLEAISKRSDMDLQTCIDNFEVRPDQIIRTQDSRNMGATYLNEIDLGTREECLRLCCETDTCDVFVYEEKSPGSCYLFHCGRPEDFKCKFTRHANYSSAVLSPNRHVNELENQIKLTKHEQDLTRLRKPEDVRIQQPEVAVREEVTRITPTPATSTTTIQSKSSKEILAPITKNKTSTGRRCSRYQFECHTSGECIAIYNACDGIPQCSDGSDEAPELGCPDPGTTTAPSPPPPPLPMPNVRNNIYEQNNQLRKSLPPLIVDNYQQPQSVLPQTPRVLPPVDVSRDNTDFIRPAPEPRAQPMGPQYNDAPMVPAQPQQPFVAPRPSGNNNWINHQGNQMPAMPPNLPYGDKNSHIFNHKESGLQVVDTPDRYKYKGAMQTLHRALALGQYIDTTRGGTGPQYVDMNMRNDYQKNYYGDMYRPQYQMSENWQQNRPPINGDMNPYVNSDNWQPIPVPQSSNDQNNPMYRPNVAVKPNWKTDLINTQAESKAYDHTVIREPKEFEHKTKETKHEVVKTSEEHEHDLKNIKKDLAHHKEHSHAHISGAEELKQNIEDLMDGEAERPGGAILSLTLGVCLTCVMAILIGCRLRIVRRRMRRGGKSPYAHDADYLVNGMYL